jgi:hypothetical protein
MVGEIGRWLIGVGVVLVIAGALFMLLGRVPWLGHLPGDILIERPHVRVFMPLGTMLLLSLLLTVLANVIARLWS